MNRKIVIFAAAVLAFAGCEKEKEAPTYIPSGEYVSVDVGEDTRTSLNVDNTVKWSKGDAIGMFCAETECANVRVSLPDDCEGKNEVFIVTPVQYNAVGGNHTFYMYYPYRTITGAKNGQTAVDARLHLQQTGLLGDAAFTMASCEVEAPAAGQPWGRVKATFRNPFSYIRFCVKDPDHATGYRKINNVSMEAITAAKVTDGSGNEVIDASTIQTDASAVFAGSFTADLVSQTVAFKAGETDNMIYVNPRQKPDVVDGKGHTENSGYDLSQSMLMLINSADFSGPNKYFRITFSFSDGTVGYSIKSAKEFERNKVYNYGFRYDKLNFNTENTIRVWPWTEITNEITFD